MARLRDVPHVLRTVGPVSFVLRVWRQGSEDYLMTWASALAYAWLFAVFPFFVFLMTLVPYLPIKAKASVGAELHDIVYLFPKQAADAIWSNLDQHLLNAPPGISWLRGVGIVLALWSASSGMATTMSAFDRCYELRESRPYYRQRGLAITITVVIAVLILLVVLLLPVGTVVKNWIIRQHLPGLGYRSPWMIAFDVARWALAVPFMISILTVLYHWGPYVKHRFNWLTPGAVFSIVVWVLLGFGFRYYLNHFANFNKTYGTVGGAAVMLLVFYIDAAVLLWGAEINSEIDFEVLKVRRGSRNFIPAEAEAEGELVGPLPTTKPVDERNVATASADAEPPAAAS
jgi:membrane protein